MGNLSILILAVHSRDFYFFIILFCFERERESERACASGEGWGGKAERERESQAFLLSGEPNMGLNLMTPIQEIFSTLCGLKEIHPGT